MDKNESKNEKFFKNQKKQKKLFKKKSEISWNIFFVKKREAILLVWPIEEISLQTELSTPPCFRIQGGCPERHGQSRMEILVSNNELVKFLGS